MTGEGTTVHICELCGDEPSETLTSDSHPEGVNLLVCGGCSL